MRVQPGRVRETRLHLLHLCGAIAMSLVRTFSTAIITAALSAGVLCAADAPKPEAAGRQYALLIGCTQYDNLPSRRDLRGPANDVVLLRKLLIEQFGFHAEDVTVLATQEDIDKALAAQDLQDSVACELPTDVNIAAAYERLAEEAQPGDTIFVLMSGHGCRQPDLDKDSSIDPEPDGLDELFLPCNIGTWNKRIQAIDHAITDDQIRGWISEIVGKGAFVFAIADSCHSGTVTRGGDDEDDEDYEERARDVDPSELGVPEDALETAQQSADAGNGESEADWLDAAQAAGGSSGLVALYAVQSHQEAIESRPTKTSPHFGRLSYTVYDVLSQCGHKITYRELAQRILWRFEQNKWISRCTPGIEGTALDRTVLSLEEWPGRSQLTLRNSDVGITVTGGALHGVTPGSVLAVYPPAGEDNANAVAGYVQVTDVFPLSSVVQPTAWGATPTVDDLPDLGRCEVVYRDLGSLQLSVSFELDGEFEDAAAAEQALLDARDQLAASADADGALFRLARAGEKSDWTVVITPEGAFLQRTDSPKFDFADVDAFDLARRRGEAFGDPYPLDADLADILTNDLERIARAENLRKLAEESSASADPSVNVAIEVLRDGEPFVPEGLETSTVEVDQILRLKITNNGTEPVSIVVFYIDNAYSIDPRFPRTSSDSRINQIPVGGTLEKQIGFKINDKTIGWEDVIVIAVGAKDQNALDELLQLQQEQLIGARTRGPDDQLTSPLARLIDTTVTATRGSDDPDAVPEPGSYVIRRISWNVAPAEVEIDLPVEAYVPSSYAPSEVDRTVVNRTLSLVQGQKGLVSSVSSLQSQFGPLPAEVKNLVSIRELEVLATRWRIRSVRVDANQVILVYSDLERMQKLASRSGQQLRIDNIKSIAFLQLPPGSRSGQPLLDYLKPLLE